MTGSEKIEFLRSVKAIKSTSARGRISAIFDEGSFIETGALVRKNTSTVEDAASASSEGVVTGYGTVNGRPVFVYAQDSEVLNGAVSMMHAKKIIKLMALAEKAGAPVIGIADCGGGLLEEGIGLLDSYGELLKKAMDVKNVVPHITYVAGYCVGISAVLAQMSDFVICDKKAKLYMESGKSFGIISEEYGSAKWALEQGLADVTAETEEDAAEEIKKLLSFLPDNVLSDPPEEDCADDLNRCSAKLDEILMADAYDALDAVKEIADNGLFFEFKSAFAPSVATAFIRLNGRTVGVVASNPKENEGKLTIDSMGKAADFISLCDGLSIPVVTIANTTGYSFVPAETKKLTNAISDLMAVYRTATTPKVMVVAGKAYGSAYLTMGGSDSDLTFALAGAEISVINPKGGADIFFTDDIVKAEDPYEGRQKAEEKFKDVYANPYVAAAKDMVDDVIEPNALRPVLASALEMLFGKTRMEF